MKRSIISFSVLILLALASCSKQELPAPQTAAQSVNQPGHSASKVNAQAPPTPPTPPAPPPPRPHDPLEPADPMHPPTR